MLRVAEHQRRRKVSEIYLAVIDHGGDGEGVYTVTGPNNERLPLVALDKAALSVLRRYSQQVANERQDTVSIICFTARQLYESFRPVATGD